MEQQRRRYGTRAYKKRNKSVDSEEQKRLKQEQKKGKT
jgi:hypothetical protein